MDFGRHILEWYLAIAIIILTVVSYMILAGVGFGTQNQFIMIALLLIILIAVNILNSIIHLRTLEIHERVHEEE